MSGEETARPLHTRPDNYAVVRVYRNSREASDYGLVVLAMGLPYWLEKQEDGFALCVEDHQVDAVSRQIERSERENRNWPQRFFKGRPAGAMPRRLHPSLIFLFVLPLVFKLQLESGQVIERGRFMTEAIADGEWWRLMTALMLHADLGHLASNVLAAFCLMWLVTGLMGAGAGWLLVLLSGIGGNALNLLVYHPTPHYSVGASTAIFGALGLLVGHAFSQGFRSDDPSRTRARAIPVVGGVTLLALLGAGSPQTDVLAHLWGFVVGGGLGLFWGWWQRGRGNMTKTNRIMGVVAFWLPIAAWLLAWSS